MDAFDPCFEVLDENKPLQINISTNKIGKGNFLSQSFINNRSNSTFKYQNFLGISRYGEMDKDNCQYAFDPCFDVLDKINRYKLVSPLIKEENVLFFTGLH